MGFPKKDEVVEGFRIELVSVKHEAAYIEKLARYEYPTKLIVEGKGTVDEVKDAFQGFFDGERTIYSSYGNPYQCVPGKMYVQALEENRFLIEARGSCVRALKEKPQVEKDLDLGVVALRAYDTIFNDRESMDIDGEEYPVDRTPRANLRFVKVDRFTFLEQNPSARAQLRYKTTKLIHNWFMSWNIEKLKHVIEEKTALVESRRCKLVLVVGPPDTGKTKLLRDLNETNPERYTYINLNLELSALLKEVTEKERPYRVQEFLRELVSDKQGVLLVDNTEILFDAELKLDPVKSLEELSRFNSVVSVWSGSVNDGCARARLRITSRSERIYVSCV